jgi:nucleoside 2-deoxyribosyltransferase
MGPVDAPKVYLAGPLGFTEAGREYHNREVVRRVREAGYEPLDPWDVPRKIQTAFDLPSGDPRRPNALREANDDAGARNAGLIDDSAAMLAILDGYDVDSGTAAEIGYAAAREKPVIGVRMDSRISGDNEETIVNLQVEWFIRASGGQVLKSTNLDDAIAALKAVIDRAGER